ncbi:DEAD/DEAH box helicase [Enterobacter ludwigii]|uniref:DEAD/DEAH box helicase n=1 Tax=Enterobacter ludwigii TaxID=299767 RepID=UPI00234C1685|nr:DEAD/DEAH box helicase [Enterobacter ludwigii]MDC7312370.1 DEAD/DEAH box helicase [Enterobacter ludwigii]MDI0402422.1 DEAD/DEAH box helicase [Enterobacter ludwigii]MDI0410943.1 DEAD/DEAH box helicase [Enterobacter ludwigii]MDI0417435.1 DEAD/DEAH box helicase [Enterobacter ludwigii]MDI0428088.1 DEAD/DEAH box helicase [Enterobacter ludwigii]
MKPKKRARYAAAVTLSKGKMFEYGVPEEDHIDLPEDLDLEMQFPLAVGTVGDFASEVVAKAIGNSIEAQSQTPLDEVIFSAQVLQAYDNSLLNKELSFNLRILAAAGFYLGDVPGNAAVQLSKLGQLEFPKHDTLAIAVKAAMDRPWEQTNETLVSSRAKDILDVLRQHFRYGRSGGQKAYDAIKSLREWAYSHASAHDLLMADLLGAVSATRIANSAWTLLPHYSNLPPEKWESYLSRSMSIKEMWPSQRLLGEAGLYSGASGVVQMPTSAGKSRATELIIRSAFLSARTKLVLVIAPFRALCQEIANDLEKAFKDDGYDVNQPSDALQPDVEFDFSTLSDFLDVESGIFDSEIEVESKPQVIILTPEKLLYILRQEPDIVQKAGLVVYDEGHQFDTGSRGVTYELLLTSIKRMLHENAQSVLISAVIQNAASVAAWLLNDGSKVVSSKSLQASRLIAFTSLPKGKDGQLQFNVAYDSDQKFFVPRVIVSEKMPRLPKERKDRFFPTQESGSIALYLGLRLLKNGGVAIFTGRKASAAKIVREAAEDIFRRGISLEPPSANSDPNEIRRFVYLFERNFGANAYLTQAATLGIFAHHGNTPQGVRLAIEYAMRQSLIRLIVCTSTLAQGVNLPIRYLLVTSAMQGRESIKVRDFHNLMGRAGRAGMYGEGTVIFTDPRLYDERFAKTHRWKDTINLINPDSAEPTGSTLLSLFDPLRNDLGTVILSSPSSAEVATYIVNDWEALLKWVESVPINLPKENFSVASLIEQLKSKKKIIEAVESFLMTYRSDVQPETFVGNSRELVTETLAYSLATEEQKILLTDIFESVARRIELFVPDTAIQQRFGRTLLGIDQALVIESWVTTNANALEGTTSADHLFDMLWPLLVLLSSEKRLSDTVPNGALMTLALGWLAGDSFAALLQRLDKLGAYYPYGTNQRIFDLDMVVDLCEQTFGFEFALLLAAVKESFIASSSEQAGDVFRGYADLLQKRLKYGLPNQSCIAFFEAGFAERVIAQCLAEGMTQDAIQASFDSRNMIRENPERFEIILQGFPSYFSDVFKTITAP